MSVKFDTWDAALSSWREHLPCAKAQAAGGLCLCRYAYPCPACGTLVEAIGEDMEGLQQLEGRCARCFMAVAEEEVETPAAEENSGQPADDSWVDELFGSTPGASDSQ